MLSTAHQHHMQQHHHQAVARPLLLQQAVVDLQGAQHNRSESPLVLQTDHNLEDL